MSRACRTCAKALPKQEGPGRPRIYCDDLCKRRYRNARTVFRSNRLNLPLHLMVDGKIAPRRSA